MSDRSLLSAALAASCAMFAGLCLAAPPFVRGDQPITVDAQSSDFDYRNNKLRFKQIKIRQGDLTLEADEARATGLDFENSQWDFDGKVRITTPDSTLTSNSAVVRFSNNVLSTATITGLPARFEQRRDKGTAKGHAGRIDYDFSAQTIVLADQAWLSYNNGDITGRTLVYSIKDQRVRANPQEQDNQRVHITINPKGPTAVASPTVQAP